MASKKSSILDSIKKDECWEEAYHSITSNVECNIPFFHILAGINGSGKTLFIEAIKEHIKEHIKKHKNHIDSIYIPTEIIISDEMQEGTKNNPSILDELIKFLYSLITENQKLKFKINKDYEGRLNEIKELINDRIPSEMKENSDMHNWYNKVKTVFKIPKEEEEFDFLSINKINNLLENISSGDAFYTLVAMLKTILKMKIKQENSNQIILLIDEPEKFLHPTLITKLAKIFCELHYRYNVSFLISTHSPILLNYIVLEARRKANVSSNEKFKYPEIHRLTKKIEKDGSPVFRFSSINFFEVNFQCKDEYFLSTVDIDGVSQAIFAEKLIIVEGIRDFVFVHNLIDLLDKNCYVKILIANGKSIIKSMLNFYSGWDIDIFVFYDTDCPEKNNSNQNSRKSQKDNPDVNKFIVENATNEKCFGFNEDIESFLKRNFEIDYTSNGNSNKNFVNEIYKKINNLDTFKEKSDECEKIVNKLEAFLS